MLYLLTPNSERAESWLKKSCKTSTFAIKKGQLEFDAHDSLRVAIALWREGFVEKDFKVSSGGQE